MIFRIKKLSKATRMSVSLLPIAVLALMPGLAANAQNAPGIEEVNVFGRGATRQLQSLSAIELAQFPAGTSPLKAIEKLPGVNFSSADPYGSYEWSTRIVVRGFNQNQMGFTLDGVPLGDMSYGNHNGLHISRAIMSENIGQVTLAQGAGSLGTASTSNLGGTLEFTSATPSDTFAVNTNVSVGSDSAQHLYGRVDSGALSSGTRFFASYSTQDTNKWKGDGQQEHELVNLKLVQDIGTATVTGFYSISDRAEIDYQDMSKDMIGRLGRDFDNYGANYARAIAAATGKFTGNVNSLDDGYLDGAGLREDDLGYVSLNLPLQDTLALNSTVYLHQNHGQGLWGTPYLATPGGAPLSIRTSEYDIDRNGWITSLNYVLDQHTLNAGFWTEENDFNQARRFYGETSLTTPTRSFSEFQSNPFFTQWEYSFNTKTLQFHLKDTFQISDVLQVEYGFKSVKVEINAKTIAGDNKTGSIETDEGFLPQIGFLYELNDSYEVFGAVSRNVRAFIGSATGNSPWSANQTGFNAIRSTLQPEKSSTVELGWRFHSGALEGVVSGYHVEFEDRLLAIQQGSAIIGNFNALANVGRVKTLGIESGVNWQASDTLSWYNSASLNRSTYKDDYMSGTTLVRTSGKTVTDAPELMFTSELSLDTANLFTKLNYKFTGARQYTYLNEGSVSSFGNLNLSLGYHFGDLGFANDLTAQLDVTNLADADYISTVGSGGFSNSDLTGTAQTLLPGAPRQFFLSLKASF